MNDGPDKKQSEQSQGKSSGTTQAPTEKKAGGGANIDDLKAKLGLSTRKPKPKPKPKPKTEPKPQTGPAGVRPPARGPGQGQVQQQPQVSQLPQEDIKIDEEVLQSLQGSKWRWPVVVGIVAVFTLLIGVLFGKIMRDRKIDNRKTEEARFLLKYLEHSRAPKLTVDEGTTLQVVEDFNKKVHDLADAFAKANTPQKKQAMQKALKDFLKTTRKFVEKGAYFTIDAAFPDVIYNQKVAFKVVQFINDVKDFYRVALELAKEGATLNAVVGPDPTKKEYRYVEIEATKQNNIPLNKGTWIQAIDWDHVRKSRQGILVPVMPLGAKEGYLLPSKNLTRIDISPIARAKASIYQRSIFVRVAGLFNALKNQGDKLDFPAVKKLLEHYAHREMLFTIF